MRNIAIGLLTVILLSIFIQPLTEVLNVTREKIVVGTALTNASRAAKNRSLVLEDQRNLDARVDTERFVELFAESFADALELTLQKQDGHTLQFSSNDGKFNDFRVNLDFEENTDGERIVTRVSVRAESVYKFKSKYLNLADQAGEEVGYLLTAERMLLLSVKN